VGSPRRRGPGGGVGRFPHVRQELLQFAQTRLPEVGENAGEISLRIDAVPLGAADQGPQPRVARGRVVVSGEQPVLPADGHAFQRPLGRVVV
jgi:hypothetical protein